MHSIKKRSTIKENIKSEYDEQVLFFKLIKKLETKHNFIKWTHCSLSGVKLSLYQAKKAKASGNKRGIPDIFLPYPKGEHHGLYIELKRRKGGVTSKEQKEFLDYANSVGYKAVVCNGAESAFETLLNYMEDEDA